MVEATAKTGQIQCSMPAYTALRDAHVDGARFAEEFDFVPARLPLKTSKGGAVDHNILQGVGTGTSHNILGSQHSSVDHNMMFGVAVVDHNILQDL